MALRERRMKVTNEGFKKSKENVLYGTACTGRRRAVRKASTCNTCIFLSFGKAAFEKGRVKSFGSRLLRVGCVAESVTN